MHSKKAGISTEMNIGAVIKNARHKTYTGHSSFQGFIIFLEIPMLPVPPPTLQLAHGTVGN